MTAVLLPPGTYRGLDTVQSPTETQANALASLGYAWVARYAPLDDRRLDMPDAYGGDHGGCWTLSLAEARMWGRVGMLILPVQWGPMRGDVLTATLGHARGREMASWARWMGIAEGCHLWCDWEGARAIAAGVLYGREYLEAWAGAVLAAGYRAGLYVSVPQPLSGEQLYGLRGYTSYWGAAQSGLPVPLPRDYAIRQSMPTTIAGVLCDPDVMAPDLLGELPVLWAA
jgi:hypothetical protein